MPDHLFKVGAVVSLDAEGASGPRPGRYVVEAQMPPVGTALQYRIKSESEGFRRVAAEHQLSSFGTPTPRDPVVALHRGEEN